MASTPHRRRRILGATVTLVLTGATAVSYGFAQMGPATGATDPAGSSTFLDSLPADQRAALTSQIEQQAGQIESRLKTGVLHDAKSLPSNGDYAFLLQLAPQSTYQKYAMIRRRGTRSSAAAAARDQLATITAAQRSVERRLDTLKGTTQVLYTLHAAMAGVAVDTDVANAQALTSLPGVTDVYPIAPKKPDLSYAVPFQDAPAAWAGDGTGQDLGAGVKIADIDSGLDYTHADFGGPGTVKAYDKAFAHDTVAPAKGSYDPAKFDAAQSWDFVGDKYNAGDTSGGRKSVPDDNPAPDPNPLDCSVAHGGDGHGTHTAGIMAGYGVTKAGKTFKGPWNSSTVSTADASNWAIGPGMAPKATIISYRVFGCGGSTDMIAQAIDRALDPNGDGSTADHVNVINLSLGSDFGSPDDGDAIEADLAVKLGVSVVVAMGNSADEYDVASSPATAQDVISVAASTDAQNVGDGVKVSIAGKSAGVFEASRSAAYTWRKKPDLKGPVVLAPSDDATACRPLSASDAARVKGKIVLTTWNEEQVSAGSDPDTGCGSVQRSQNLRKAGARGFLFGDNHEVLGQSITGDKIIPGALMVKSGAAAITNALDAGRPVTVTGTVAHLTQIDADQNDAVASYSSRGIGTDADVKPDVTAVGDSVSSASVGSGAKSLTMSGTSMATPMVAGEAALVIAEHPDWTAEEVKADIVNTADHNLYVNGSASPSGAQYGPVRVGSGRIDAGLAIQNSVLAYVTADPGAVGVSFGPVDVTKATTLSKSVTVANTGTSDANYAVAYDPITTVPGVAYTATPRVVSVPAGGTAQVTVKLSVPDASTLAVNRSWDPTRGEATSGMDLDPATGLPEVTLAEASGNLTLTPQTSSGPQLRVPVYSAPRPVSAVSAQQQTLRPDASGNASLTLSGTGFGNVYDPITPLGEGFDLQATSPEAPTCVGPEDGFCVDNASDRAADLQYVGTTSDYPEFLAQGSGQAGAKAALSNALEYFALTTYGAATTPSGAIQDAVFLDVNGDGVPDLMDFASRLGDTDVLMASLIDLNKKASDPSSIVDTQPIDDYFGATADGKVTYDLDTAPLNSDALVLPISIGQLIGDGYVHASDPVIHYGVLTFSPDNELPVDSVGMDPVSENITGSLALNLLHPGVQVTGTAVQSSAPALYSDEPDQSLAVHENIASVGLEDGRGVLLLHLHNATGARAQVVAAPVALSLENGTIDWGDTLGLTVHVAATPDDPSPNGEVDITDGQGHLVATGHASDGVATLTYTPLAGIGPTHLTATYTEPDRSQVASVPVAVSVKKAEPTVLFSARPRVVVKGHRARLTLHAEGVPGGPVPTGTVSVTRDRKHVAGGHLSAAGTYSFTVTVHKPGVVTFRAVYSGNSRYRMQGSYPFILRVVAHAPKHRRK